MVVHVDGQFGTGVPTSFEPLKGLQEQLFADPLAPPLRADAEVGYLGGGFDAARARLDCGEPVSRPAGRTRDQEECPR